MTTEKKENFTIKVVPQYNVGPISYVNYTRFSQVSGDVIMDVGTLDDHALIAAMAANADHPEIPAYIAHRIGMSVTAFLQLRKGVEEIWVKLKATGIIEKLGIEE